MYYQAPDQPREPTRGHYAAYFFDKQKELSIIPLIEVGWSGMANNVWIRGNIFS